MPDLDEPDALSRALMRSRPALAGRVHCLDGSPWCDGINHTTMCQPDDEERDPWTAQVKAVPDDS